MVFCNILVLVRCVGITGQKVKLKAMGMQSWGKGGTGEGAGNSVIWGGAVWTQGDLKQVGGAGHRSCVLTRWRLQRHLRGHSLSPPHTLSWCLLQDSCSPPLSPQCPDPSPTPPCLNQPNFPSTKQNLPYLAFFKWFLPCLWPQSPETIKAHLNVPLLKSVSLQYDLSCDSQDCITLLCGTS